MFQDKGNFCSMTKYEQCVFLEYLNWEEIIFFAEEIDF